MIDNNSKIHLLNGNLKKFDIITCKNTKIAQ